MEGFRQLDSHDLVEISKNIKLKRDEGKLERPKCFGAYLGGNIQAERDCERCDHNLRCTHLTRVVNPVIHNHGLKHDTPTASELLVKAAGLMADRGKQYDKPEGERSMGRCVTAFNIITGKDLSEAEGWLLLQILKDVRQWQRPGYHADSAEDCIAYAALKAEAKSKEA